MQCDILLHRLLSRRGETRDASSLWSLEPLTNNKFAAEPCTVLGAILSELRTGGNSGRSNCLQRGETENDGDASPIRGRPAGTGRGVGLRATGVNEEVNEEEEEEEEDSDEIKALKASLADVDLGKWSSPSIPSSSMLTLRVIARRHRFKQAVQPASSQPSRSFYSATSSARVRRSERTRGEGCSG